MKNIQLPGNSQINTKSDYSRTPKEIVHEKEVVTNNIIKMPDPSIVKATIKTETSKPERIIEKHVETKVEKHISQPIINNIEKHEHITQNVEKHDHITQNVEKHEHITQNLENHITNPVIKETKEIKNVQTKVEKVIETRNIGGKASKDNSVSTRTTTQSSSSSRGNALESFLKNNPEPQRSERRGTVRFPRDNK